MGLGTDIALIKALGGGGSGGDDTFVVTATVSSDGTTVTFDKTAAETVEAIKANKPLFFWLKDNDNNIVPVYYAGNGQGFYYQFFAKSDNQNLIPFSANIAGDGENGWVYSLTTAFPDLSHLAPFPRDAIPSGKVFEYGVGWTTEEKFFEIGTMLDQFLLEALTTASSSGTAVLTGSVADDGTIYGIAETLLETKIDGKGCSIVLTPEQFPLPTPLVFSLASAFRAGQNYAVALSGILGTDSAGNPVVSYGYYHCEIVLEARNISDTYSAIVTVKCDKVDGTVVS